MHPRLTSQSNSADDRPLRILQLGSTAYRGGVTTAVLTLCTALHQQGQEVMLICDGGDLDPLRDLGIEYRVTDFSQRPLAILRSAWAVHQVIRQFRPDVIHVHGRSPALLCHLAGRIPDWFTLALKRNGLRFCGRVKPSSNQLSQFLRRQFFHGNGVG